MAETITPSSNTSAAAAAAVVVAAPGNGDDGYREPFTLDEWVEFFKFQRGRDSPSEARNALLVIAVLITTATYQAVLSPPGGLWQETKATEGEVKGHTAGKSILGTNGFHVGSFVFLVANASGFFGSIFMILILTEGFPLRLELGFTILALGASYDFAMISILPEGEFISFLFAAISTLLPMLIVFVARKVRELRIRRHHRRSFGP